MKKSLFDVAGFLSFCAVVAILVIAGTPVYRIPKASASDAQTRPADITAYSAGDVMGESPVASYYTFAPVAVNPIGVVTIRQASLQIDTGVVGNWGPTRLHLYSAAPTAQLDGAAYNVPAADRAGYLGYVSLETPIAVGDTAFASADLDFRAKIAEGARTLYGVLQAVYGFDPPTATTQTVTVHTEE